MTQAAEFYMFCSLSISLLSESRPDMLRFKRVDEDFGPGLGQWWAESEDVDNALTNSK